MEKQTNCNEIFVGLLRGELDRLSDHLVYVLKHDRADAQLIADLSDRISYTSIMIKRCERRIKDIEKELSE